MSGVYGAAATRERPGWFFGLTGPQVFLVLAAAFPAWLAMALGRWVALLVLVPLWALATALVCVPVRGWSAAQWIGVLVRHVVGRATGWTRWQSRAAAGELEDPGEADLPGVWSGIEIHDGPPMAGRLTRPAVIQDHAARTWAATARITHPGIGMSDEHERHRMGAGLAELLEAASGGRADPPGRPAGPHRSLTTAPNAPHGYAATPAIPSPTCSGQIHAQLDAAIAGAAVRTEAFLTVVVREDTIARDARRAGRGVTGRARILYGILAEVEARLGGAIGCTHVTWLDTATSRSRSAPASNQAMPPPWPTPPSTTPATTTSPLVSRLPPPDRPCEHRAAGLPPRGLAVGHHHDPAAPQGRRDGGTGPCPGALPDRGTPRP